MIDNINSPFFEDLIQGAYLRIKGNPGDDNPNQMVRIVGVGTTSKPYQCFTKEQARVRTKVELIIQFPGKASRKLTIQPVSNQQIEAREFVDFLEAAKTCKIQLPLKTIFGKRHARMQKILTKQHSVADIERMVQKKLESNIRKGNFKH